MFFCFKEIFDNYERENPLNFEILKPREGVFGGRTGACALLVESQTESKPRYR